MAATPLALVRRWLARRAVRGGGAAGSVLPASAFLHWLDVAAGLVVLADQRLSAGSRHDVAGFRRAGMSATELPGGLAALVSAAAIGVRVGSVVAGTRCVSRR